MSTMDPLPEGEEFSFRSRADRASLSRWFVVRVSRKQPITYGGA